jgi:hypothetical protein
MADEPAVSVSQDLEPRATFCDRVRWMLALTFSATKFAFRHHPVQERLYRVKMRYLQNEDMFSDLHPIADTTGPSGDKIASASDWCDGGPMSAFWARSGRMQPGVRTPGR